jgi:DNA polymerase I-like protein with 3'-5' exonuclease and polymerase domains
LVEEGIDYLATCLELGDTFVGHNIAFDWSFVIRHRPSLLPEVFAAYEASRVHCTEVREKLLQIEAGALQVEEDEDGGTTKVSYSLGALAQKYLKVTLNKGEDSWRTRYAELLGVPLDQWPDEAVRYAKDDAVSTLQVFQHQQRRSQGAVTNEFEQVRAALCLRLMSEHGIAVDAQSVEKLGKDLEEQYKYLKYQLKQAGIFRPDKTLKSGPRKGQTIEQGEDTKKVQEMVVAAYEKLGIDCPTTETDQPSRDEKTLRVSGDPILQLRAKYGAVAKNHDTYLPLLRKGVDDGGVHPGFDVLKQTGRTSSYKPNLQNLPREGGIRECFVARPGYVFSSCDYSSIELVTWAEICLEWLGFSDMATVINEGRDPHIYQGALSSGTSYEALAALVESGDKEAGEIRRKAKPVNFGIPGMLGAKSLVTYAADGYGVVLTLSEAEQQIKAWKRAYKEGQPYLDLAKANSRKGWVKVPFSNRIRGKVFPTQAANTPFQGLASDGIKYAMWLLAKAMYIDKKSPLYGSRFVAMVHDETILEIPETDHTHEAVMEHHRLMKLGMGRYVTRVKVKTGKPAIAKRWYKEALPVYRDGKLVCYEPANKRNAA